MKNESACLNFVYEVTKNGQKWKFLPFLFPERISWLTGQILKHLIQMIFFSPSALQTAKLTPVSPLLCIIYSKVSMRRFRHQFHHFNPGVVPSPFNSIASGNPFHSQLFSRFFAILSVSFRVSFFFKKKKEILMR